jgi:hypothetical protein
LGLLLKQAVWIALFSEDVLRDSHTAVYVCFIGESDPFEVFKILLTELLAVGLPSLLISL